MIHGSKEIFEIRIHDPRPSAVNLPPHLPKSVLGRSPWPIPEVGFIEYRFKDWRQPIQQCLLAYPIINGRNAERTKLPRFARLRD